MPVPIMMPAIAPPDRSFPPVLGAAALLSLLFALGIVLEEDDVEVDTLDVTAIWCVNQCIVIPRTKQVDIHCCVVRLAVVPSVLEELTAENAVDTD